MKNVKFLEAEEISLDEVNGEFVSVKLAGEKFVIDVDTLYDMSFRFAEMLAKIESREEEASEDGLAACAECCGNLH
jgi:hypothetical protein